MAAVMRGWQPYNSSIYTGREYSPFEVGHRCRGWNALWGAPISFVSIHSINLFHMERLVSPQGHCYVYTGPSVAFSHPCAGGADVGSSSWAPHPWLDLAQPAGSEATWHPGWPGKPPSPVGRRRSGLRPPSPAGRPYWWCWFQPGRQINKATVRAFLTLKFWLCCNLYFENSTRSFWGEAERHLLKLIFINLWD